MAEDKCPFVRIREYPSCFEDCPEPAVCPMHTNREELDWVGARHLNLNNGVEDKEGLLLTNKEIGQVKNLKYSPDMNEEELFMVALRGIAKAQISKVLNAGYKSPEEVEVNEQKWWELIEDIIVAKDYEYEAKIEEAKRLGFEDGYTKGQQHSIGTDKKLVEEAKKDMCDRCSDMDWAFKHKYMSENISPDKGG